MREDQRQREEEMQREEEERRSKEEESRRASAPIPVAAAAAESGGGDCDGLEGLKRYVDATQVNHVRTLAESLRKDFMCRAKDVCNNLLYLLYLVY